MVTVVNNPGGGEGSGAGMLIGVAVLIIVVVLFFIYGLPRIRGGEKKSTDINIEIQTPGGSY